MANYFTLEYETAASSPGYVELNYGSSTTNGLTVQASLHAGTSFTPTHYKMWGVELSEGAGIVTESGAVWLPYTSTRTVNLAYGDEVQYAYAKFKNASEEETTTFQSNGVTFEFVEPVKHPSVVWKTPFEVLKYDYASSNILTNSSIEVDLSKSKISQLIFNGSDFSGLRLGSDAIYVDPNSALQQLMSIDDASHITVSKVFQSSARPLIMVDSGSGYRTITAYDGTVKTTVSGIDATRVSGVNWDSEVNTLAFDIYHFSEYSFCTVQKVEFTEDSDAGAYVGSMAVFKIYIQDSNGEPVEAAPVTISGISGYIGDIQESMPLDTNASGIAEFSVAVSGTGVAIFRAFVDGGAYVSSEDLSIMGVAIPEHSQRSLFTQYEQIRRSASYDDDIADVNNSETAEPTTPTISGSSDSVVEHDLNVIRTLLKQLNGTTNWYDNVPIYFDPTNTDISDTQNKPANLTNIAGNTLDSKTIITAISDNNSGTGFNVSVGSTGFLFSTSLAYATVSDRRGLPIFNSTTHSGAYFDADNIDEVVGIDLIDLSTGGEFRDSSGNIIFAKFHDGSDYSGSGDGTDVYVKFYTDTGAYTTVSGDPSSIMMVYPYRKLMADVAEYEWERTDFISSWEGDAIIVDQIMDLMSYIGATDNESYPIWTAISGSPIVDSSNTSLWDALNNINTSFGDRIFTEQNYLTNGQSISSSIDALDMATYDASQLVADTISDKYIEVVTSDITANTAHLLPAGLSYTPYSTAGQVGKNMDVFLDGQLMTASTGINGANYDGDYAETDSTHITFHFKIHRYSNITYMIRA